MSCRLMIVAAAAVLFCAVATAQTSNITVTPVPTTYFSGVVVLSATSFSSFLSVAAGQAAYAVAVGTDLSAVLGTIATVTSITGSGSTWSFYFSTTSLATSSILTNGLTTAAAGNTWLTATSAAYTASTGSGSITVKSIGAAAAVAPSTTTYTVTITLSGSFATIFASTTLLAQFTTALQTDISNYYYGYTITGLTVTQGSGTAVVTFKSTMTTFNSLSFQFQTSTLSATGAVTTGTTFQNTIAAYTSATGQAASTFALTSVSSTSSSGSIVAYTLAVMVAVIAAIVA